MPDNDHQFQKALFLLDGGEVERGEATLRDVLSAAAHAKDDALLATARCCLGELLVELNRWHEAIPLLKAVAALDEYDDLFAHDRRQAIQLLRRMGEA